MCGHTHDVVIYSKFCQNLLLHFGWDHEDLNFAIPITLAIGFFTTAYMQAVIIIIIQPRNLLDEDSILGYKSDTGERPRTTVT